MQEGGLDEDQGLAGAGSAVCSSGLRFPLASCIGASAGLGWPGLSQLKPDLLGGAKKQSVKPALSDKWAMGGTYEDFMGRWSRLLAPRFVSWLAVRPSANWLDVGCGTGALADAICVAASPASVVACDPSEPFIEYARRRQVDPRVSFVVARVGHLPTRPGGFDSVTSLLALNFFPEPAAAIDEMRQLVAADGLQLLRRRPR